MTLLPNANSIMRNTARNILLTLTLTLLCNFSFSQQDEKLAAQYFQNHEYEKAAEIYRQLYYIKSTPFYYTYYLQCIIELNDFKTAEKFIKKLKKKKPSHLKYYVDLGYVYQKANQSSKSIHQYDDALKKLSANQRQISDLANAFLLRQLNDYAIQTYLKGRKLLNFSYTYGFELGNIYEVSGNYKEMINEYLNLLEFNNAYLSAVQQRLQQTLSNDPSNNKNELLKTALLKRIQKNPDKRMYSEMLLWLSIQQKDFEMAFIQAKSLDNRFNEEGAPVFNLAGLCTSNKAYDIAIKAYNYLINLGEVNNFYMESKIRLLDVKYIKITSTLDFDQNDLIDLEMEDVSEINILGKNSSTIMLSRY